MDYQDYVQAMRQAARFVEAQDDEEAIKIWQKLLAGDIADLDKAVICIDLAVSHARRGRESEALDWYDKGMVYEAPHRRGTVAEAKAAYLAEKGHTQESLDLYTSLLAQPFLTEADKARIRENIEVLSRPAEKFSAQAGLPAGEETVRQRQRQSYVLPLAAAVLILAGGILMVLGAPALHPAAPMAPASTATSTLPPTPTPEPLVPTRTPLPPFSATPSPTRTPAPTRTPSPMATSTFAPTSTSTPRSGTPATRVPITPATPKPTTATTALPTTPPTTAPPPATTPSSTATPPPTTTSSPTATPTSTATPTADATSLPSSPSDFVVPANERFRLGVSLPGGATGDYDLSTLHAGWVMDWAARSSPALPPGVAYMPTVRMSGAGLSPAAATLTAVAAARPGSTWLIANEPDVRWQDNVDPVTYARLYHEAYTAIKAGDPAALVAAGGIAQPTPLRLRYLDLVLQAYQAEFGATLPAQAWHIHNYMLHEERDSWGVDIPPGIPDNTGVLYGVDDSGNLAAFRSQIYAFRRWMSSRGYGGQPLIVSEFGVPMPEDYGFPPERMAEFLRETWRFFLTAADGGLGDPSDGGRLVQRWCWFSLNYGVYPTGNLIDANGRWTPLGRTWISYVSD